MAQKEIEKNYVVYFFGMYLSRNKEQGVSSIGNELTLLITLDQPTFDPFQLESTLPIFFPC